MFSHVGAASVTFERRDTFQEELLSRSDHSPAREINALSHVFHEEEAWVTRSPTANFVDLLENLNGVSVPEFINLMFVISSYLRQYSTFSLDDIVRKARP